MSEETISAPIVVMWLIMLGLIGSALVVRPLVAGLGARPVLSKWNAPVMNYLFLLWFILVLVFILGPKLASGLLIEGDGVDTLAYNGIMMALSVHGPVILLMGVLCVVPAGRLALGAMSEHPRVSLGEACRQSALYLLAGMPLFLGGAFLWHWLLAFFDYLGWKVDSQPQELVTIMLNVESLGTLLGLVFAAVVIAPLSEEFIFRGVLYRYLRRPLRNATAAAVVSGVLFGAIHLNIAALGPLSVLGYLLARSYERSADFRIPVIMHGIFNFVMILWLMLLRVMDVEML